MDTKSPAAVRRAREAAGVPAPNGGISANKTALSPSIASPPPPRAGGSAVPALSAGPSWSVNGSVLSSPSTSTHAPVQVPLGLPSDSGLQRGSGQYIKKDQYVKKEQKSERDTTPDVERVENETARVAAAVADAVALTEAMLQAKLSEVEGEYETEKEQLIAQAAEHRDRVRELLDMLRQAESTAADESGYHEEEKDSLKQKIAALEGEHATLAASLDEVTCVCMCVCV